MTISQEAVEYAILAFMVKQMDLVHTQLEVPERKQWHVTLMTKQEKSAIDQSSKI